MSGLGDTLNALARYRRDWEKLTAGLGRMPAASAAAGGRLSEVTGFGSDPGNLRMLVRIPPGLPPGAPLVVVLHGCGQTAGGYDLATGWSVLADRCGFAVLAPEQRRANNPNLCFNWFQPEDTAAEGGEVESIRQMIAHLLATQRLDPRRVFVTGLSAGGAMTSALLARDPGLFAAAAIFAGLPFAGETSVQAAFESMRRGHDLSPRALGALIRDASAHRGPWPSVSVWHGTADTTVSPRNAADLVAQWRDVQGLPDPPSFAESDGPVMHRVWRDAQRRELVQDYMITGMAHGTPIATTDAVALHNLGEAAPFVLDVGVPSTYILARQWGLIR
jgi:feruloyl esterase